MQKYLDFNKQTHPARVLRAMSNANQDLERYLTVVFRKNG